MTCIVVPVDGSCLSENVMPYVVEFARGMHAEVYLVQVIDTELVASGEVAILGWVKGDEDVKAAEAYLSRLANAWREMGIDAKWRVLEGKPVRSIVDFARSHEAGMIAMCTHGRAGLGRAILGSVADEIMREASIPTLLVRPRGKAPSSVGPAASAS